MHNIVHSHYILHLTYMPGQRSLVLIFCVNDEQLERGQMSYATKNKAGITGSIVGVFVLAFISLWQFYQFVTFEGGNGVDSVGSGSTHLWWAIALAVLACIAGVLVFSVFLRHDSDDDLHITSSPFTSRGRGIK